MEKVKKFKEAEEIFEIINPYEERGRQEGIEIGISRGREEGREEERIEIALKMLKKDYATELITDVTGFTCEEIDQLQSKI